MKNSKKESEKIARELSDEELMEITGGWYDRTGYDSTGREYAGYAMYGIYPMYGIFGK